MQLSGHKPVLPVEVKLDDTVIYRGTPGPDITDVQGWFDDDIATTHCVTVELRDKTQQHTILDSAGNITDDCQIFIDSICIDDIDISRVFYDLSKYRHDGNGQEALHERDFYRVMGCNGTVRFEFNTPVYAWLLEHA